MKKLSLVVALLLILTASSYAIDIKWNPLNVNPAEAIVGQQVVIKAPLTVLNGSVNNLKVIGKVDGQIVYNHTFATLQGPTSQIITVNWTAAHSKVMPHIIGQPSNVKIEFIVDPQNTSGDSNTSDNRVEKIIKVRDGFQQPGPMTNVKIKKPGLVILKDPCIAARNDTTDLVPIEFKFNRTGFHKFYYSMKYKNTGPRCVKSVKWRVTYMDQGVQKVLAQGEHKPVGGKLFALKAGDVKLFGRSFDRVDLPQTAFERNPISEEMTMEYSIDFTFTVDFDNGVNETNEGNNSIVKHLKWDEH